MALQNNERKGEQARCAEPYGYRQRKRSIRPKKDKQADSERDVGELRKKLEGEVRHRARGSDGSAYSGERDDPGAENAAAHLRKRQQFGSGIADQPPRQENPPRRSGHEQPPRDPFHR